MNNNFENDPRRIQEKTGRPIADKIYIKNWGLIEIKRYEKEDNLLIDMEFAIDLTIRMPNGMILNGQEKFLSFKYAIFNSLTVEYMQNPNNNLLGDWFKLAPQFYMCAYFNENKTDFIKYILIDWPLFVIYSNINELKWVLNSNKDGKSTASFKYINFNNIPKCCIIDKKF